MQKIIARQHGGPEVLELTTGDKPAPGPGEVLVEIEAAGINYIDVYQREGHIDLPKPYVPGWEGVGMVAAVGPGVTVPMRGERVAWINVMGSYASQMVLPAEQAIALPDGLPLDHALALFQGVTAQYLVTEYQPIRSGDTVLVHAAAGGVGQLLVQWVKHLGGTVIGTASSAEKLRIARELGADHVVDYSGGFLNEVLALTGGRGVDLAFDAVGATTFADTVKALARRGMAVSYGRASGPAPDVEVLPLILKGARVAGASLFEYIDDPTEMQGRAREVIRALSEGWLRVGPTTFFPLSEAATAHRAIQGRSTIGKLALRPAD